MNIEVFGKQKCGYCSDAKALLERKKLTYTYTDYFVDLNEEEQNAVLARAPGAASYPIILIDNVYIGGFSNLNAILS